MYVLYGYKKIRLLPKYKNKVLPTSEYCLFEV